jgi:hypothetical protein
MSWTSVLHPMDYVAPLLSVAFLLTIYELSSFYIVIVPIIKQKLADGIGKVGESINDIVSNKI